MKKIPALLFVCIMVSGLCMEIHASAQGCGGDGTQEIHLCEDWNITSNISRYDETIILSGNLTIAPNGTLTLWNTILKLDCTIDGEYGIEVKPGGTFHAYNSRIETTTEDWNKGRFWFYVSENTDFKLESSYIRKCGVPYMGGDYTGLTVKTENASVRNCTFTENNKGIVFSNTKNASVSNCVFQSNKHWGVHIYNCSNINIEDCTVLLTAGTGIRVEHSNESSIKRTRVSSGGELGISVLYSDKNTILNSVVSENNDAGISFINSNYNLVKKCTISEHSGYAGIYAENSNTNEFCDNDFDDNMYNAWDSGINNWHENYWSDYSGLDSDADGIGDVPYNISGGNNKDYFPLMGSAFVLEIANETHIANETKILDKNLVVKSAGKLTLSNATLIMNCTYNGECQIEVYGEMSALDSNITSANPDWHYLLSVRKNATFKMQNSSLSYSGWDLYNSGLIIEANNSCIENSVFSNNYCGIVFNSSGNALVSNCTFSNNLLYGIRGQLSHNCDFKNCSVLQSYVGISLYQSANTLISGCRIGSNSYQGIILDYSESSTIENCDVHNNSYGIYLRGSSNNQLTNCNVYNNSGDGIYLYYSSNNNTITNCSVYNNYYGIRVSSSNNNQITNCDITENYYGLHFTKSHNITIKYTDVSARLRGMYFYDCAGIILTHSSISGASESIYSFKSNLEIENITGKDISVRHTCANITSASFTGFTYLDEYNCINVSWHLKIRAVIGTAPAKSASVIIYDAQDRKILDAETDENGEIECKIMEYTSIGPAQKINYTPHKIVVVKNEFAKTCSVIMCRNTEVVMELEEMREEAKFISTEMFGLFAVVFGVIIMTLVLEYMSRRRYRRKRKL